jgi:hypothetical protein
VFPSRPSQWWQKPPSVLWLNPVRKEAGSGRYRHHERSRNHSHYGVQGKCGKTKPRPGSWHPAELEVSSLGPLCLEAIGNLWTFRRYAGLHDWFVTLPGSRRDMVGHQFSINIYRLQPNYKRRPNHICSVLSINISSLPDNVEYPGNAEGLRCCVSFRARRDQGRSRQAT